MPWRTRKSSSVRAITSTMALPMPITSVRSVVMGARCSSSLVMARTRALVLAVTSSAPGPALRSDVVDFLNRQGCAILSLQEIKDIRDLAGRPHGLQLDPTVGKLIYGNFRTRVHAQM